MATVGTLIVRVGADLTRFDSALKRTDRQLRSFTRQADRAGKALTRNLTAPLVAVGAAAFASAVRVGQMADKLLDLEHQTGLSTTSLQEFRRVAAVAGVSTDVIADAATRLTLRLKAAGEESTEVRTALGRLGVSTRDAGGNLRTMDEILPSIIRGLQGMDNITERNSLAMSLFGRGATELLPVLGLTADAFEEARREAHDLGLVLSRDTLEAANKFRKQWDTLKQVMGAAATQIGSDLIPLMSSLVGWMQDRLVPALQNVIRRFSTMNERTLRNIAIAAALVAAIGPLILMFNQLAKAIYAVTTAMVFLRTKLMTLLPFLGPKGWLVLGLGAAVTVLMGLRHAFRDTRSEVDLFVDSLRTMSFAGVAEELHSIGVQIDRLKFQIDVRKALGDPKADILPLEFALQALERQQKAVNARYVEMAAGALKVGEAMTGVGTGTGEVAARITGPINTAGIALSDLQDRVDSLRARMESLTLDIALADTTDEAARLTDEFERTARMLERAAEAAARLRANLPEPRVMMVDSGLTGGGNTPPTPADWSKLQEAANAVGSAFGGVTAQASNLISAFASGGKLLGGIALAGVAFNTIAGILDRGRRELENFVATLRRVSWEVGFLGLDPAAEFQKILDELVGWWGTSLGSVDLTGLTMQNFDEFAAEIAAYIARLQSVPDAVRRAIGLDADLDALRQAFSALKSASEKAADGVREFADALLNAPRAFNLALRRHQAAGMVGGRTPDRDIRPGTITNRFDIRIDARDRSIDEVLDEVERAAARRKSRGGTTRLKLAVT